MAADSDGCVQTVLTCKGDLSDPHFPRQFKKILAKLKQLLFKGSTEGINLQKVEPWNSVRVTFTIPKEAAVRLRQLAQQGNATLLQLGILSVQVEGDEVISLRMSNRYGEAQEIVMHTGGSSTAPSTSSSSSPEHSAEASNVIRSIAQSLSQLPGTSGTSAFKSPNVVAPLDSEPIPLPPSSPAQFHNTPPFPFASMTHAAHAIHNRDTLIPPPPPYPGPSRAGHQANVALSSPLLVNLLQNDGFAAATGAKSKPLPVPKTEQVPNSAFFNTKLPESSINLPTSNLSQIHIASSNSSPIHLSNSNSTQIQSANPNPISSQLQVANPSPVVLANHSSQVHAGNSIHIGNPNPTQIHLANNSSSQINLSNPNPIPSQAHPSTSNSSPSFILNPNSHPTPLAQTTKASHLPFLTKQQPVVNPALFSRQIHQSVSTQSQTTIMRPHSQTPISIASSNNSSHPQPQPIPNILHSQTKPGEHHLRFPLEPSTAPLPLPLPSSNPSVSNIVHSDPERSPRNHQQTMVEAKDFTPNTAKLPSSMSSIPLPIPLAAVAKTDEKAIGSEHKTENVKFSETSQTPHVNSKKQPVMLINPLTGDLEPIPSEVEDVESSQFALVNSLDDPFFNFPSPFNDPSNSLFSDDDDVTSILNKKPDNIESNEPETAKVSTNETKNSQQQNNEKIKLRLKLEKNEPVMPVYKADVSFVQGMRKIRTTGSAPNNSSSVASNSNTNSQAVSSEANFSLSNDQSASNSSNSEEPKVPPLHISLRGRNAAVVVNSKDEKKWKEGFKAAASGVKKANKATVGSGVKENPPSFVKKNLVFTQQQFTEENEEDIEDEEESEDEEEDDEEEEDNEDEEHDGEDTEDDDDDEENDERDVEQNLKTRLEPGEIVSPYSTPIRTAYPTAEEVTSILRSMPSDTHHKMSLSFPKEVKKKESIKKQIHQRLVEGPLSLFHKSTKSSKLKTSNSLLKSVVKRAKEARMLTAVRHSTDKQRAIGNGVQRKMSSEKDTSSTATQSPAGAPNKKFKSNRQPNIESNKIVPLNHNSPDIVKKIVNNMNKLSNAKSKDNTTRSRDNNVVNSMANFSNVTVNTITNANTSNTCSFNKNFTQTNNSLIQNKKLKDFHMLNDKDIVNFNKAGLKSISSLLNNTMEPFTNLENNSCLLPIIHDIELTEKKIKQKMLESDKIAQLQQLQEEQEMMMAFAETEKKSISTSTMHDHKLENTRNSTESIRQESVRSSTENNVNQSEPGNSQGEDSGIESMDALSEKSPNQSSESPLYKNNEKDEKPVPQSINTIHGVKPEKIVRTSSIETQMPLQNVKRGSIDSKSDIKQETILVKKETKECCNKVSKRGDTNQEIVKVTNQRTDKLETKKSGLDLKDVKTENVNSPTLEDPQPIRITPALYTYSNSEKVREDTPSPSLLEEEEEDHCGNTTLNTRPKRKRKLEGPVSTHTVTTQHDTQKLDGTDDKNPSSPNTSKSLLEQLLIEIPAETRVEPRRSMTTRNTRSQNKFCDMSPEVATSASSGSSGCSRTPHSSPSLPPDSTPCKPSPTQRDKPRGKSKRGGSSGAGSTTSSTAPPDATSSSDESNTARPNKRKCSENAAELIKACMGVEDNFHLTGKKPHLEPSSGGGGGTVTPSSTSPPAKTPRKKGTADSSDDEAPLSDMLVKHNKSCDTTVKNSSSNSVISQPVVAVGDKEKLTSVPSSLPSTCTSVSTNTSTLSTNPTSSPLIRTSSRITESKANRRSNRQNKASNDNNVKVKTEDKNAIDEKNQKTAKPPQSSNNNNKSACGLMKNNNCITRGASKATNASEETLATVRRKTRSANVHDSELGPGKRRRSSKDAK